MNLNDAKRIIQEHIATLNNIVETVNVPPLPSTLITATSKSTTGVKQSTMATATIANTTKVSAEYTTTRGRPRSLVHDNSPVSGRTEQDTIQTRLDQFEKSVSCYTRHKL